MKALKLILILITGLFLGSTAIADGRDVEIDRLIALFNDTNIDAHKDACNRLQWSGLTETRLFDVIEKNLQGIDTDVRDNVNLDLAAYYLKALAASGQAKYRDTIQKATESKQSKIQRYANLALNDLDRYATWNNIISKGTESDPEGLETVTHFTNMINSDDWELRRMASKRIYHDRVRDKGLIEALNQKLLSLVDYEALDRLEVDSLNWMMKALAATGDNQYRDTLELIASDGKNAKNRRYADAYIVKYLE